MGGSSGTRRRFGQAPEFPATRGGSVRRARKRGTAEGRVKLRGSLPGLAPVRQCVRRPLVLASCAAIGSQTDSVHRSAWEPSDYIVIVIYHSGDHAVCHSRSDIRVQTPLCGRPEVPYNNVASPKRLEQRCSSSSPSPLTCKKKIPRLSSHTGLVQVLPRSSRAESQTTPRSHGNQ